MKYRNKNKAMPLIIKLYVNFFHHGGKEKVQSTWTAVPPLVTNVRESSPYHCVKIFSRISIDSKLSGTTGLRDTWL